VQVLGRIELKSVCVGNGPTFTVASIDRIVCG
jgi:hypothetical protein